eukprot:TRINITY_DN4205_c0_g1_i4.p1 TRINITY_DN4205_c0_g1~~TRINITY_DN4205_c0_g1_i4.p1  ORF type:complete len:393 (-),score=98.83 TRINITY_DN4205_c0_g1_i4:26-1204(-)
MVSYLHRLLAPRGVIVVPVEMELQKISAVGNIFCDTVISFVQFNQLVIPKQADLDKAYAAHPLHSFPPLAPSMTVEEKKNRLMLEKLASQGKLGANSAVMRAMLLLPRCHFVPEEEKADAYKSYPMCISRYGFNVSAQQIYTTCMELLDVHEGCTFLDIGCGCGYLTAVAGILVGRTGRVVGWDLNHEIVQFAHDNIASLPEPLGAELLQHMELSVHNCLLPTAPEVTFDRIYCGASCPKYLLYRLCLLLAPGGLLVGPVVNSLVRVRKHPRTQALEETRMFSVRFGQLVLPDPEEERAAYESVTAQALADWQGRRSRRQQQEQQGHHQHQPQQQVSGLPRCALCGRGAADACLNPCCHTTACVACAASLAACPACGAPVQRVVHAVCSTPV